MVQHLQVVAAVSLQLLRMQPWQQLNGVIKAGKVNKAVTECFLSEKNGYMIFGVTGPFEFHTQEMRDVTHEVHRGKGVKLSFKDNFSITVRAKVDKVVYI